MSSPIAAHGDSNPSETSHELVDAPPSVYLDLRITATSSHDPHAPKPPEQAPLPRTRPPVSAIASMAFPRARAGPLGGVVE